MKNIFPFILIIAILFTPSGKSIAFQPGVSYPAIDAYVQSQMQAWHIPALALIIVQNGKVAHLQTFSWARSGQPVTAQSGFEIGSCSKSFTALAVMQLRKLVKLAWMRQSNGTCRGFGWQTLWTQLSSQSGSC